MGIVMLGVLFVGFVLVSCVLAIVAFNKVSNLDRKLSKLKMEVERLVGRTTIRRDKGTLYAAKCWAKVAKKG